MDKRYGNPNTYVTPTRFCCPRHRFNEHEVFSFIVARLINPDIALMRGPRYPDFDEHPDWIVCGYDTISERRESDLPEPIHAQDTRAGHRYGPLGLTFAKHWIGLKEKEIILNETVADIIDDDFIKKIDYNYVYTNMGGMSYTMHSHMVDLFNPFEVPPEDPEVGSFDYSDDEAFLSAADTFQPIFCRQIYWANNLASERILVQKALDNQKSHAIAFDQYVGLHRYTVLLKERGIRWVVVENYGNIDVYYMPPLEGDDGIDAVTELMKTADYIHNYSVDLLCANFKVKSDARHYIRTANQKLGIATGDLPEI